MTKQVGNSLAKDYEAKDPPAHCIIQSLTALFRGYALRTRKIGFTRRRDAPGVVNGSLTLSSSNGRRMRKVFFGSMATVRGVFV